MAACSNIQHQFDAVVKSQSANSSEITLEQINKWLTEAKLMGKKVTPNDTKSCFDKFKSETIDCEKFVKFLDDLGQRKGIPPAELKQKLVSCDFLSDEMKAKIPVMQVDTKLTDAMKDVVDKGSKLENTCNKKY
ncbi:hypothetical protein MTP99_015813 [Tenebrio molitor]|nr:hypothetical protein MTP99_015813 [Tenebrio molitor]